MSTTAAGNSFRDAVCELLRTKYPDAQVEQRIGGTKVDIRFTSRSDFGDAKVYVVECKDYDRPLTKTIISQEIWTAYQPLLASNSVDQVLVVSRKPLGADAHAFMGDWRNAEHRTFDELAESLMGLRPFIRAEAAYRPTEDMPYIEARVENRPGSAIEAVDEWVQQTEGRALAIRGGYGQGKTSFAKHLTAVYAKRHLESPAERIPILYRLGEVVHETRLEGLFGAMFTGEYAPGYRFSTLAHLNRSGRLLIILDGFDEMKHAMTASDFLANFREFNRLLEGQAKVILLGRPNALTSDVERTVFRGKTLVAGQEVNTTVYAPWEVWTLDLFTIEETRSLLTQALSSFVDKHAAERGFSYAVDFVVQRVEEILKQVPADLLRRPVHVHLVADLGADPAFDFRGFDEYKLYDHFIRKMVERDVEKKMRARIPLEARLTFQRELAWWAWRRIGASQGFFSREDIPPSLLRELPDGDAADEEGKLNEYIVSTLTEEKESGTLFFAHRSFQEFLVGERARLVKPAPAAHTDYAASLTPDVIGFLKQGPDSDYILGWYETLQASSGPLSVAYLDFFASFPNLLRHIRSAPIVHLDAWTLSILALATHKGVADAYPQDELMPILASAIRAGPDSRGAAAATLAMLRLFAADSRTPLLIDMTACLIERTLRRCRPQSQKQRDALTFERSRVDFAVTWLSTSLRKKFPQQGEVVNAKLGFDANRLSLICAKELDPDGALRVMDDPINPFYPGLASAPKELDAQKVYGRIERQLFEAHKEFLTRRTDGFPIVDVGFARGGGLASTNGFGRTQGVDNGRR